MVLLVLEAHRALHFGDGVDELAQRVAGQRVVVAAGVDVLEVAGFVVAALGVEALEEEAFDFVGGVERVAVLGEAARRRILEPPRMSAANGVPSLSITWPNTSTLPEPKSRQGTQ